MTKRSFGKAKKTDARGMHRRKNGHTVCMDVRSIWTDGVETPRFAPLKEDIKTDVLIVGGGLAGILCAYKLQRAGVNYVVAEAGRICDGITKNTTAKVTAQHGFIYHDLLKKFGVERTRAYWEANTAAVKEYARLAKNIDCSFEEKDAYTYSLRDHKKVERELSALERIGAEATYADQLPLPFSVAGAVRFKKQAQLHPLRFLAAIAKDLRIFEETKVLELLPHEAVTSGGRIAAKKIVVATHFPFINKHGSYFLKMYQHRSYVLALKNAPNVKGMYVDEHEKGLSFRNHGDLLFLGGGSHRTGEKGGNWEELTRYKEEYYPQAEIVAKWATQDCMTLDGAPYIGPYSKRTRDLYVATGFNKWGMTSAMVAADILTDMILEKENPYAATFSPSRSILRAQLAVNGVKAVLNLLTPTVPRCPHLGCALKYNKQERSWDCPCHGSRFTEDKKLIDNPATGDIKK